MADSAQDGRSADGALASITMSRPSALRRLRSLIESGPTRQLLVAEAASALLWARIGLLRMPFQRLAADWGQLVPAGDPAIATKPGPVEAVRTARAIGWAVTATASIMPFKAMCIQQAVAAHGMLMRRGVASVVHYGVGHGDDGSLVAHVWLEAAGVEVTGYPVPASIAEIGAFVPPR